MNFINEFNHKKGTFCFLSNLQNYLHCYGLDISEAWLGASIGYMGFYHSLESAKCAEIIHGRSGDFQFLLQHLQKQIAKPLMGINISVAYDFHSALATILFQNNIAMIWINDFYLEYSQFYKKKEFWRLVVIIELRESEIIIFDNEIKVINFEVFKKSVNHDGENVIYYSSESNIKWASSELEIVKNGLNMSLRRLYKIDSRDDGDYGITGMSSFIEGLRRCLDANEIYNYYFEISRPGGLTVSRENMRHFFYELNKKYPVLNTQDCQLIYGDLSENWRKVAGLLFKLSVNGDEDLKERIIIRIHKIIELEVDGSQAIKKLIDNL